MMLLQGYRSPYLLTPALVAAHFKAVKRGFILTERLKIEENWADLSIRPILPF
jgi:hypothetical protein